MTTPAERLSPRMTADEIWAFVADAHTAILTTLRRDGVPISMPLWFACIDRKIYFRTRGRKLERISHDPRASVLFESGERWAELKGVHMTGRAERVEPDADLAEQFQIEIDRKYAAFRARGTEMPSQTGDYYRAAVRALVCFTPDERILNWDNSKLANH